MAITTLAKIMGSDLGTNTPELCNSLHLDAFKLSLSL